MKRKNTEIIEESEKNKKKEIEKKVRRKESRGRNVMKRIRHCVRKGKGTEGNGRGGSVSKT